MQQERLLNCNDLSRSKKDFGWKTTVMMSLWHAKLGLARTWKRSTQSLTRPFGILKAITSVSDPQSKLALVSTESVFYYQHRSQINSWFSLVGNQMKSLRQDPHFKQGSGLRVIVQLTLDDLKYSKNSFYCFMIQITFSSANGKSRVLMSGPKHFWLEPQELSEASCLKHHPEPAKEYTVGRRATDGLKTGWASGTLTSRSGLGQHTHSAAPTAVQRALGWIIHWPCSIWWWLCALCSSGRQSLSLPWFTNWECHLKHPRKLQCSWSHSAWAPSRATGSS